MSIICNFPVYSAERTAIQKATYVDETNHVTSLLNQLTLTARQRKKIQDLAYNFATTVRQKNKDQGFINQFLHQYGLNTQEGIALMCLAEALLRIPDATTINRLLRDKLAFVAWQSDTQRQSNIFVNASTWGLMLSGRWLKTVEHLSDDSWWDTLKGLVLHGGESVIRRAVAQAMKILGRQFVMGETIKEGVKIAVANQKEGYTHSFDMLGEAAMTAKDAEYYFHLYQEAIRGFSNSTLTTNFVQHPDISVKLSALHPRYEWAQYDRVMTELYPRLLYLIQMAQKYQLSITIDAEESARLDISLDIIQRLTQEPSLKDWHGLGLAVQAYQKRAFAVLEWLKSIGKKSNRRWMVRLVKGAYWDNEIKWAQEGGLPGYPVFTRKVNTDISYLTCAQFLLQHPNVFYPQFATHNAHTIAAILTMATSDQDFEMQKLHGMGDLLYKVVRQEHNINCRIYAPIGNYRELLPYLVRRLLENGANTSFIHKIADPKTPIHNLIADPIRIIQTKTSIFHPSISLPKDLYGDQRINSKGYDLNDPRTLRSLANLISKHQPGTWESYPIINGKALSKSKNKKHKRYAPFDQKLKIGDVWEATPDHTQKAIQCAYDYASTWGKTPIAQRATTLKKLSDLLEDHTGQLVSYFIYEGGKTLNDAIAEVREAIDFCRYYANEALRLLSTPQHLPGPTGESNDLFLYPHGVFICISPWNFPLAIFLGQITAALVTGNTVIAKPAEQTPLIGAFVTQLILKAGIPHQAFHYLPGPGETIGQALVDDPRIAGVVFTGSAAVAKQIQRSLAQKEGPIIPFIAETGGQNAMIVDSSALPEQVIRDVITSAFRSAGQRCSALRVLFLQEDIADSVIKMLKGAMKELVVGDPTQLKTDVGPVIDDDARQSLLQHLETFSKRAILYQTPLSDSLSPGFFFTPVCAEIPSISTLKREFFGPFLHIIRFKADQLDQVIEQINQTGYGLTLGIHSRIQTTIDKISKHAKVGNMYANRNMIGAVVGVQPFGGEGLSGTGPKAGGPHYLMRFLTERVLTQNLTTMGGNADLFNLNNDI